MNLTVLGSNSQGNCYLIHDKNQCLIIECGIRIQEVKKALKFDLTKVVGCIITHGHSDHCKYAQKMMESGIFIYATEGTLNECKITGHHRNFIIHKHQRFTLGKFSIQAFGINHDTADPVGYLINHPDTGLFLFLTDTFYCDYNFPGLNNIIIEANYDQEIIDDRSMAGSLHPAVHDRVMKSHMSIETCRDFLKLNDLKKVNNIVLIHLSDGNANAIAFKKEIEVSTGKTVHIAKPGLSINFDSSPF